MQKQKRKIVDKDSKFPRGIQIVSDGTIWGSQVLDAATGENLDNVVRIEFDPIDACGVPVLRAKVYFTQVKTKITAQVVKVAPYSKPARLKSKQERTRNDRRLRAFTANLKSRKK